MEVISCKWPLYFPEGFDTARIGRLDILLEIPLLWHCQKNLWQSNNLDIPVKDLFPSFAETPWNSNLLLELLKLLFWECFARRPEQKITIKTSRQNSDFQPIAKLSYHSCSVNILEELLVVLNHQRVQVILKAFESGEKISVRSQTGWFFVPVG